MLKIRLALCAFVAFMVLQIAGPTFAKEREVHVHSLREASTLLSFSQPPIDQLLTVTPMREACGHGEWLGIDGKPLDLDGCEREALARMCVHWKKGDVKKLPDDCTSDASFTYMKELALRLGQSDGTNVVLIFPKLVGGKLFDEYLKRTAAPAPSAPRPTGTTTKAGPTDDDIRRIEALKEELERRKNAWWYQTGLPWALLLLAAVVILVLSRRNNQKQVAPVAQATVVPAPLPAATPAPKVSGWKRFLAHIKSWHGNWAAKRQAKKEEKKLLAAKDAEVARLNKALQETETRHKNEVDGLKRERAKERKLTANRIRRWRRHAMAKWALGPLVGDELEGLRAQISTLELEKSQLADRSCGFQKQTVELKETPRVEVEGEYHVIGDTITVTVDSDEVSFPIVGIVPQVPSPKTGNPVLLETAKAELSKT